MSRPQVRKVVGPGTRLISRVKRRRANSKKMMNQIKLNWKPWLAGYGVYNQAKALS